MVSVLRRFDVSRTDGAVTVSGSIPADAIRKLAAKKTASEKVGYGWIVSRRTSTGTSARIASVTCWSHSPDSGPTATPPHLPQVLRRPSEELTI